MKKYILIISTLLLLNGFNSCSERDLDLLQPEADFISDINSVERMQMMLNGAYFSVASADALGSKLMVFGDILGDKIYNSPSRAIFLQTYNYNYNGIQNQFAFYGKMYDTIVSCNMVINNTSVAESDDTIRIKSQARILRALAYYYLVSYYSPTPTSGVNQEYGVPLVLGNYDLTIKPARATVKEIYTQIISDLNVGLAHISQSEPIDKVFLGANAAKLLLSRVYLTRRDPGYAQLALQYSSEIISSIPDGAFKVGSISASYYANYFKAMDDAQSEDHPETIWELDMNFYSNQVTGVFNDTGLPTFYSPGDNTRRGLLANKPFYDSFGSNNDVRRGSLNIGLFSTSGVNDLADDPKGYWIMKYPRTTTIGTTAGLYFRDIKVFRYSEAYLNRIEALRLTGQTGLALTELNSFAASRKGTSYTGANLLNDILNERAKEFYGEGQRFLDLKRYNLPVVRNSNCSVCNLEATDHRFVLPVSQSAINSNPNLKQYPGYTN